MNTFTIERTSADNDGARARDDDRSPASGGRVQRIYGPEDDVSAANRTITETHVLRLCEEARERLSANRGAQALELVHQALRLWPDSPVGLSLYGICVATTRGEYAHAIHVCRRAIRLAPENAELRTNLGRVYRLMGDNGRAYQSFLMAWRCNRSHPGAAAELARMGVRHPPVLGFLPRSHWCNRGLGLLRHRLRHAFQPHRTWL